MHETLDQVKEPRAAWLYNPGQRRVRRAPNVAYDNPGTAADAMRTSDQLDMYNGAIDRYDWKLVGLKEIYVPYNSYRLQDPSVKFKDILTPLHINQDLVRYELHRVWVVDATLKDGARHVYKRRTFYFDEEKTIPFVVMNSREKELFEDSLPSFEKIVESYLFIGDDIKIVLEI